MAYEFMLIGILGPGHKDVRKFFDFVVIPAGISIKRLRRYPRHEYLLLVDRIKCIRYLLNAAKALEGTIVAPLEDPLFGLLAYKAFEEGIRVLPSYALRIEEFKEFNPKRVRKLVRKKLELLAFSGPFGRRAGLYALTLLGKP